MSARNCSQSVLKGICKLVKVLALGARPPRDGLDSRQHVIDAMLKLVTEHFLPERSLRQFSLDPHSVDSRSQQIGVVLKKIDIVLLEFPELPRVNFQHTDSSPRITTLTVLLTLCSIKSLGISNRTSLSVSSVITGWIVCEA